VHGDDELLLGFLLQARGYLGSDGEMTPEGKAKALAVLEAEEEE